MEKSYNTHVPHLPKHLLQYIVDQDYNHYTPIDQAVWRYVMRQNINYLPSVCHGSYLEGLKLTGISVDTIPSMYGMSRILKDIGWYAVAVDGFIPPSVFMEFQAHNVLVIAADIRQIEHIGYTPAPDILHEAAGHAPIIADNQYSEYLKLFGEIGSKAFSSAQDIEIFEAIRELSILKEAKEIDDKLIKKAEKKVLQLQSELTNLSEMAQIRNLHWWTVEYGLIGSIENPKIYGAGLLSSISESVNCLGSNVLKLPYSIEASNVTFDITSEQPQLFVARDFQHLTNVLTEFSNNMAFKKGGDYAIQLALGSKNISTCEFDTGVQVSGIFDDVVEINKKCIYLKTKGSTALSYKNKQIKNHGINYHSEGFGVPIGRINNIASINGLKNKINEDVTITYDSGICVKGHLLSVVENHKGDVIILSFQNCSVLYPLESGDSTILFDPSWGIFDLVIGNYIVSAYPFAADRNSFPIQQESLQSHTIHSPISKELMTLNNLYNQIRMMREKSINEDEVIKILNHLMKEFPRDWLLTLEICELIKNRNKEIFTNAKNHLKYTSTIYPEYKKFILDGLKIIS